MTENNPAHLPFYDAETAARLASDLGVDGQVLDVVLRRLADAKSLGGGVAFSVAETAFMNAHSGTQSNPRVLLEALVQSEIDWQTDQAEALTLAETANFLSVGQDVIERMIREGGVYAYQPIGPGPRLVPQWQFADGRVVPHLGAVISALPEYFTSLDIRAFVINARIDHRTDDSTVGLIDWLAMGNDPAAPVALAHSQHYTL